MKKKYEQRCDNYRLPSIHEDQHLKLVFVSMLVSTNICIVPKCQIFHRYSECLTLKSWNNGNVCLCFWETTRPLCRRGQRPPSPLEPTTFSLVFHCFSPVARVLFCSQQPFVSTHKICLLHSLSKLEQVLLSLLLHLGLFCCTGSSLCCRSAF